MIMQPTKTESITIIATDDSGESRRYELPANEGVFVGRSGNCGFKLPDVGIADIHCRIEFEAGKLWIQDWMSNGGTRVNGESIWTKVEVQTEDQVRIGTHVLTFINNTMEQALEPVDQFTLPETRIAETPDDLFDLEVEFSDSDVDEFDSETVQVLQAEIEYLRAELAQRDADQSCDAANDGAASVAEPDDDVLARMQELIDEADRSDERVAILEELLHAAEDANRAEQEERQHLEGWLGDIETRIGQREEEHAGEIDLVRNRLEEAVAQQEQLQNRLKRAAGGDAGQQYEEALEELQLKHQQLQEQLEEVQKENLSLQQRLEQTGEAQESLLREERAKIAQEQAKVSRLRYELTAKLSAIEELPKSENAGDQEAAVRIRTLREHLREIHEQEKKEEREAPLTTKLAKLWKRVEA